jgi:hypothetical protein
MCKCAISFEISCSCFHISGKLMPTLPCNPPSPHWCGLLPHRVWFHAILSHLSSPILSIWSFHCICPCFISVTSYHVLVSYLHMVYMMYFEFIFLDIILPICVYVNYSTYICGLDGQGIGVWFQEGARDFSHLLSIQTGSGAHQASHTMGTGDSFFWD